MEQSQQLLAMLGSPEAEQQVRRLTAERHQQRGGQAAQEAAQSPSVLESLRHLLFDDAACHKLTKVLASKALSIFAKAHDRQDAAAEAAGHDP